MSGPAPIGRVWPSMSSGGKSVGFARSMAGEPAVRWRSKPVSFTNAGLPVKFPELHPLGIWPKRLFLKVQPPVEQLPDARLGRMLFVSAFPVPPQSMYMPIRNELFRMSKLLHGTPELWFARTW